MKHVYKTLQQLVSTIGNIQDSVGHGSALFWPLFTKTGVLFSDKDQVKNIMAIAFEAFGTSTRQ